LVVQRFDWRLIGQCPAAAGRFDEGVGAASGGQVGGSPPVSQ